MTTLLWAALTAAPIAAALIIARTCPDPDDQETDWFTKLDDANALRTGHVEVPAAELRGGAR